MKVSSGIQKHFKFSYEKMVLFFVHKNKKKQLNKINTKIIQINRGLYLNQVFSCEIKYNYIIQLLIDQKLISEETHFWVDFSKANKKLIVVLIKLLQVQGYYKDHKMLSSQQIHDIALNTFGVDITTDYIRKIKFDDMILN